MHHPFSLTEKSHSVLMDSTGFEFTVAIVLILIVTKAINSIAILLIRKIHQLKSVLKAKFCNQLLIPHHAIGAAITKAIPTKT